MYKLFDSKLYREGVRCLKNFGIIATAFLTAFPLFMILSEIYDNFGTNTIEKHFVSAFSLNPVILLVFCVFAPLMAIMLFNFTTNRAASDFYFAIPKTRLTVYFSFFMSVLTWVVIMLAFGIGIPMVISLILNKFLVYNLAGSLFFIVQLFITSFYVIAACLLAISVTGTTFSNIVVSLLIIFVPRLFITAIAACGMSDLSYVEFFKTTSLLSHEVNMPVGMIINLLVYGKVELSTGWGAVIYTVILGIVYLILGAVLFNRHPSESSGKAGISDKMRAIFRIALGSAIGLGAVAIAFSTFGLNLGPIEDFGTWLSIVAVFTFAFVVYCAYELIMTKSMKSMVGSMKGFIIVLIIDIVAFGAIYGVRYSVESYKPEPEEISGIYLNYDSFGEEYFGKITSDVMLKDKVVNRIVSDSLKETIKREKDRIKYDSYSYTENKNEWAVYIVSDGRKHYRRILVTKEDSEKIVLALEQSEALKKAFTDLPEPKNVISVYCHSEFNITEDEALEIYKTFREEVTSGSMPFSKYYNYIQGDFEGAPLFGIDCEIYYNNKEYNLYFQIHNDFEETVNKYLSIINKHNKGEATLLLKELNKGEDRRVQIAPVDIHQIDSITMYINEKATKKLYNILKDAKISGITAEDNLIMLCQYRWELPENEDKIYLEPDRYIAYFALDEKQMSAYNKLAEKYGFSEENFGV